MVYAAAPGTDTTALLALPTPDSDSWGGFAVTGHICGHPDSFDAVQDNVRQAFFLGKKGGRVGGSTTEKTRPYKGF